MQHTLKLDIPGLLKPITYTSRILLTGSCFTEHISDRLQQHKFNVLSNPNGILFNPISVADSINSYLDGRLYQKTDLFYLNELWNSWDHHTRFSHIDADEALQQINESQQQAAGFIKNADFLLITLGSAFQYYLVDSGRPVSNNHRAPSQWFEKRLLSISVIREALDATIARLQQANQSLQVIFTISPVRHIRDGVVENNRSKARLIEVVHELCSSYSHVIYFPAYELLIDILRDYRYYDVDFVHPNFLATSYVWERFADACISNDAKVLMQQVADIRTAAKHRPRFPQTKAHVAFMQNYLQKCIDLEQKYPTLDLQEEKAWFAGTSLK